MMMLARLHSKTRRARSDTIVDRRVTLLFNAPNLVLAPLDTVIYFGTTTQLASHREG
jgi:hypothetical protein